MRSQRPFPETLSDLLDLQEVSQRELVRRTKKNDGWGSPYSITELLHNGMRPTMHAMESIAKALFVDPQTFAEYRLGAMRGLLDPDQVGFEEALKNLERLNIIERAEGEEPSPARPKKVGSRRRVARGGRGGSA